MGLAAPAAGRGEREREWERMGTVGGSLFLLALKKKRIRKGYEIESYFKGNF